ncbi:hypothetical protein [Endozoicomonas sp. ALB115]|uniref:hypothetical protein n=1 Tax=Endozoicomonas sp. ALB115 TaxID=3403074 RepID=UPI003BB6647A
MEKKKGRPLFDDVIGSTTPTENTAWSRHAKIHGYQLYKIGEKRYIEERRWFITGYRKKKSMEKFVVV